MKLHEYGLSDVYQLYTDCKVLGKEYYHKKHPLLWYGSKKIHELEKSQTNYSNYNCLRFTKCVNKLTLDDIEQKLDRE